MNGWRMIESVPTDGTPVLVWLEKTSLQMQVHGATYNRNHAGQVIAIIGGHFAFDLPKATHWMPLPEPPSAD